MKNWWIREMRFYSDFYCVTLMCISQYRIRANHERNNVINIFLDFVLDDINEKRVDRI